MAPVNKAIVLTPAGAAAIAVVRLSGPAVGDFLREHFSAAPRLGRCVHGRLHDGPSVIDDPVVVLVSADVADVNLHGGPWTVRCALELARREGFDIIEGPQALSTAQAVDGSTPLMRDMLLHLPWAQTPLALAQLAGQPAAWDALRQRARIVPDPLHRAAIAAVVADRGLYHLLHPPRVAIVGVANVGKSTLANRLFAQDRAITADAPGTTRDWVGELANLDGLAVMLVDTPGIRATPDRIEAAAIAQSSAEIGRADLVVLVLDAGRPLQGEQAALLERFGAALRVINKCDVAPAWDPGALRTVATTGAGIPELREAIRRHFACDSAPGTARWWTLRQRELLAGGDADALDDYVLTTANS